MIISGLDSLLLRSFAVQAKYQRDVIISGLVTFIAAYHHARIFNSWVDACDFATGSPKLTDAVKSFLKEGLEAKGLKIMKSGFLKLLNIEQVGRENFDDEDDFDIDGGNKQSNPPKKLLDGDDALRTLSLRRSMPRRCWRSGPASRRS